jgi:hypothetical protein
MCRPVMMHRGETPRGESSTRATLFGEDAPRACGGEAELPASSPRLGRRHGAALAVRRRPASVKPVSRPVLVGEDRCSDPLGADGEARGRGEKIDMVVLEGKIAILTGWRAIGRLL